MPVSYLFQIRIYVVSVCICVYIQQTWVLTQSKICTTQKNVIRQIYLKEDRVSQRYQFKQFYTKSIFID